uniref:Uncharacterized protein n=1 Tax=Clastoptera arizonana TaxID=38151 RepID=A0A1B6DSY5_9HEMI
MDLIYGVILVVLIKLLAAVPLKQDLYAKARFHNGSVIVGKREEGDRLLHCDLTLVELKANKQVGISKEFPLGEPFYGYITEVEILNLKEEDAGEVIALQGGWHENYVRFSLRSQKGVGLDYVFLVYGIDSSLNAVNNY